MTDRHDRPPDPAALDELRTAFGVPAEPPDDDVTSLDPAPHGAADDRPAVDEPAADDAVLDDAAPDDAAPDDAVPDEPPGDGAADDVADEPADDELFVVEQTSPDERGAPAEPITIVRIDDISGSVGFRTATEPAPAGRGPAGTAASDAPHGASADAGSEDGADAGADAGSEEGSAAGADDGPEEGSAAEVVVIADDDELPDPVYVEGSLDRSTDRSIVFIEDDDTGDSLPPEIDRDGRRGIEPRLRERRVAVKRAQSRKRLKWVALGIGVVFVVVGGLALLGSPLFAVRADQVTITGNVYTDPVRLEAIVDDLVGTPALRVDTERLERELEAISWVDEARVRVDFPHAATIEIRERAAMTTYQGPDGRFRVLDREGRVLDVIEQYPFAYLLIDGPDPADLDQGEFAPSGYAAASELAKNLTASVRGRVEYVDVTADGSRLVLYLDDGSPVFFGEARDLFAKLLRLETVLTANPTREPGPIDVSTDDVTL